jgi:hypothetical protein
VGGGGCAERKKSGLRLVERTDGAAAQFHITRNGRLFHGGDIKDFPRFLRCSFPYNAWRAAISRYGNAVMSQAHGILRGVGFIHPGCHRVLPPFCLNSVANGKIAWAGHRWNRSV